jgi:DNA replication and repair protein RecF
MPSALRVTRIALTDFRSYPSLDLDVDAPLIALTGENGAGKTNLLEALSLFAQGRGLRRADFGEMARVDGPGGFSVSIVLDDGDGGEHRLGCGAVASEAQGKRERLSRIDGRNVSSSAAFAEHIRLVWLTPDLDGLFRGSAGERRRFLDRLVLAIDATHGSRVQALERALRTRNRLLDESPHEAAWLNAVEQEVAEAGIAVAAARAESVTRLSALIADERNEASPFPWASLALEGEIDRLVVDQSALEAEDAYRALLRNGRTRDRAAGRTLIGPQTSDLIVRHGPKDIAAQTASTGEQKALLIGLVLAHARLVAAMSGIAPLVLIDEIAAHLDIRRRAALYADLAALGAQVWMTGADPALFDDLPTQAARFSVTPGRIDPL